MYAEGGDDEQAAVGRLSSMSLMAAVTASGMHLRFLYPFTEFHPSTIGTLGGETHRAFVKEVERVGHDPVYWVRREASFALGALAKVVPEELVINSLVRCKCQSPRQVLLISTLKSSLFSNLSDGMWFGMFDILLSLRCLLSLQDSRLLKDGPLLSKLWKLFPLTIMGQCVLVC
jgi:hypothetical protein